MRIQDFRDAFENWPVIPAIEIEKQFPGYDRNALTRWQKAGYIEKIRNGFYRLANRPVRGEPELMFIANRIYQPSYVSLQSALAWYGFIPEGVFTITSVSTLKTQTFQTPVATFTYQSLRNDLFFGYRLEVAGEFRFKIADPAKALLDLLYLNPQLNSEDHFYELRLNSWEIQEKLDINLFEKYLSLFGATSLESRAKMLLQFLNTHAIPS